MSKFKTIVLTIGLVADLITLIGAIATNIPLLFEISRQLPLTLSVTLIITIVIALVLSATIWRTTNVDPKFKHLKVYYSSSADSPRASHRPKRPYYIVNNYTSQAYYVPDFIASTIRQGKISWSAYSSKDKLHSYFISENIKINNNDATDEKLGLWFLPNGKIAVSERKIDPELLLKLQQRKKDGKLKHYQLIFLFPRYCWLLRLRSLENRAWPTSRRIIANYSNNTAFSAPAESLDLYRRGIIDIDGASLSFTSMSNWCKQKRKLDYSFRTFATEELLEDQ